MNNYNQMKYLITQFSGQARSVTIPAIYIELLGDYQTAVLLNQIVFYSDKSKRTDGYFYKSYLDWEAEIFLTEKQVRRSTNKLKELGLVETMLKKANGSPTLHYKLDTDEMADWILTKGQNRILPKVRKETDQRAESLTVDYSVDNSVDNYSREEAAAAAELKRNFEQRKKELNAFGKVIQSIESNITFNIGIKEQQRAKFWLEENNENAELILYAIERAAQKDKKKAAGFSFVEYLLKDWSRNNIQTAADAKAFEESNEPSVKNQKEAVGSRFANAARGAN